MNRLAGPAVTLVTNPYDSEYVRLEDPTPVADQRGSDAEPVDDPAIELDALLPPGTAWLGG
jgi:hypothetical protein